MAQNDHRINAQGMDRRNLKPGQVVELSSGRFAMLTYVEQRQPTFKGFVQFMAVRLDQPAFGHWSVSTRENECDCIMQAYHSSIRRIVADRVVLVPAS